MKKRERHVLIVRFCPFGSVSVRFYMIQITLSVLVCGYQTLKENETLGVLDSRFSPDKYNNLAIDLSEFVGML